MTDKQKLEAIKTEIEKDKTLPEDLVNEDLEQAIDKYLNNGMALRLDWKKCDITFSASQLIKFSNYIAQWQKEQMIK